MMIEKIKNIIADIVLLICLIPLLSLLITGIITHKPTIFGYRPFFILTESMIPTIPVHSVVIGKPIDPDDIQIGDIVSYKNHVTIIHRVIDITDEGFAFKGDNNPSPDREVITSDQIGYKIIKILGKDDGL